MNMQVFQANTCRIITTVSDHNYIEGYLIKQGSVELIFLGNVKH